jgi:hypothetical protein
MRVTFKVKKSVRPEPHGATIEVYNLTAAHRAAMRTRGLPIILSAGYTNAVGQIYEGVIRWADSIRHGADWITKIETGDGEVSYRLARLSRSFGAGTPVSYVVSQLVNTLGPSAFVTTQTIAAIPGQFSRGYVVHGPASVELDAILSARGYEWHMEGGKVVVIPRGATTGEMAVLLTPSTGLIGSVEHGSPPPGQKFNATHSLKLKALIQPTIKPAGLVQVQADGIGLTAPAFFRVETMEHIGDTHGNDWYTEMDVFPVPGS